MKDLDLGEKDAKILRKWARKGGFFTKGGKNESQLEGCPKPGNEKVWKRGDV